MEAALDKDGYHHEAALFISGESLTLEPEEADTVNQRSEGEIGISPFRMVE